MNIAGIQDICRAFEGTTEDIKWEDHLCFNVGGKMYLITSPSTIPVTASFKVSDDDFDMLSVRPGCRPAPYLARYKWIHVDDLDRFSGGEWRRLLAGSYRLVFEKLPAKTRAVITNKKS